MIGAGAVAIILASVLAFLLLGQSKDTKDTAEPDSNKLESYEEGKEEEMDDAFFDETDSLNEEEQKTMKKEVLAAVEQYYQTMFNFDENTEDYSDALTAYYGTGDLFEGSNADEIKNVYQTFKNADMKSEYKSYHPFLIANKKNKTNPEVSVMGFIEAEYSTNSIKSGDYAVVDSMELVKVDGEWKIYTDVISTVCAADTIKACRDMDYPATYTLKIYGEKVMVWDFTNPDGALSDEQNAEENTQN